MNLCPIYYVCWSLIDKQLTKTIGSFEKPESQRVIPLGHSVKYVVVFFFFISNVYPNEFTIFRVYCIDSAICVTSLMRFQLGINVCGIHNCILCIISYHETSNRTLGQFPKCWSIPTVRHVPFFSGNQNKLNKIPCMPAITIHIFMSETEYAMENLSSN